MFFLRHYKKFKTSLERFEAILYSDSFPKDDNIVALRFLYLYNNKFNLHFIEGTFEEGIPLVDVVLKNINDLQRSYR